MVPDFSPKNKKLIQKMGQKRDHHNTGGKGKDEGRGHRAFLVDHFTNTEPEGGTDQGGKPFFGILPI